MKTAGTEEAFELKFLYFNHKDQRWQAEVQIGEIDVVLASTAGMGRWYVKDHIEVEVSRNLCHFLSRTTCDALADYQSLKGYKRAFGSYPKEKIQ